MAVGKYNDGLRASSSEVQLRLSSHDLVWESADRELRGVWAYGDILLLEKPQYGRPFVLGHRHSGEARLSIQDDHFHDEIIKKLPRANKPRVSIAINRRTLAAWTVAALAVTALSVWALPKLVEPLAAHMPESWEHALGNYAMNLLVGDERFCEADAGTQALQKMTKRLADASMPGEKLEVLVVDHKMVNAFAVPGHRVVIMSSLIREAESADEVAGVLAHEMGHVKKRHPIKGVVSALGLQLVMQIIFGSGDTARATGLMHELMQQKFARGLESEADAVAADTLHDAHIDHRGIIAFFERMHKKEGDGTGTKFLTYFSSHPATEDRITALKAKPRSETKPPLLTAKEWQAMKSICGKTSKRSF